MLVMAHAVAKGATKSGDNLRSRVADLERRLGELEQQLQTSEYYRRLEAEIEQELKSADRKRPRTREEAVKRLRRTVGTSPESLAAVLEEDDE